MAATYHTKQFYFHLLRNITFGVAFIFIGLLSGMCGYHYFENMAWTDAFVNAAMILSGMGPLTPLTTHGGKIFAGFYALFSGLAFIAIIALIFSPVVHRFMRQIHLESTKDS